MKQVLVCQAVMVGSIIVGAVFTNNEFITVPIWLLSALVTVGFLFGFWGDIFWRLDRESKKENGDE